MSAQTNQKTRQMTYRICITALFMALNIAMSSFRIPITEGRLYSYLYQELIPRGISIPVPGGYIHANDIIICTAAIILDPFSAFMVGGVGSFLGDFFFYPLPMYVSLVTHGLQAVVISLFSHRVMKNRPVLSSGIGVAIGAVIMVSGYYLGGAFIYSTTWIAKHELPYQILQAVVGAVAGMLLCHKCKLIELYNKKVYRA